MNKQISDISIEILAKYSEKDAAAIGRLLPYLSDSFSSQPIDRQVLEDIITSPYHDQLVARDHNGIIIGTLTLTITMGAGVIRKAWIEDFIVDPATQGMGVGSKLWDASIIWCQEHRAKKLEFTSRPAKATAQQFYLKRGAVIRETNFFRKQITNR